MFRFRPVNSQTEGIPDIVGVILQIQRAAVFPSQDQIIAVPFNIIRADIVPEIMALSHHIPCVKVEIHLLPLAVKIVENTQALGCVQLRALGTQGGKVRRQAGPHTGKIGAGLLDIFSSAP